MARSSPRISRQDRARGCLVGLAIGDALGATVEFLSPPEIQKLMGARRDLIGEGWLRLQPGEVTDETEIVRVVGESLVACRSLHPGDLGRRLVSWINSSPKDIGKIEREAIRHIEAGVLPMDAGIAGEGASGNGPAVRGVPLGIFYSRDRAKLRQASFEQTLLTHDDAEAQWGAYLVAFLVGCLVEGISREEASRLALVELKEAPEKILQPLKGPIDLGSPSSYIGDSLNAVLFEFLKGRDFEKTVVAVVNRGGDSDATGALAGALAGALYGLPGIPSRWSEGVQWSRELAKLADRLVEVPR